MIPAVRAKQLEDIASYLERHVLALVLQPGQSIDVPFRGRCKPLDHLCAQDLAEDAKAFRRDALKLRNLCH